MNTATVIARVRPASRVARARRHAIPLVGTHGAAAPAKVAVGLQLDRAEVKSHPGEEFA